MEQKRSYPCSFLQNKRRVFAMSADVLGSIENPSIIYHGLPKCERWASNRIFLSLYVTFQFNYKLTIIPDQTGSPSDLKVIKAL